MRDQIFLLIRQIILAQLGNAVVFPLERAVHIVADVIDWHIGPRLIYVKRHRLLTFHAGDGGEKVVRPVRPKR